MKTAPEEKYRSMLTHSSGCTFHLFIQPWLSAMNGSVYRWAVCYINLCLLSGFPSHYTTQHSASLSLLLHPQQRTNCYLNLLFPAISPALHERRALLKRGENLTCACESSHKGEKSFFVILWALCAFASVLSVSSKTGATERLRFPPVVSLFLRHNEERKSPNTQSRK